MMPMELPSVSAVQQTALADAEGRLGGARARRGRPGSEKQAITKAEARLSLLLRPGGRAGLPTSSTWRWVSMPGGPSARVRHSISGPPALRSGSTAASMARVTAFAAVGIDDDDAFGHGALESQCSRIPAATQNRASAAFTQNVSRETSRRGRMKRGWENVSRETSRSAAGKHDSAKQPHALKNQPLFFNDM